MRGTVEQEVTALRQRYLSAITDELRRVVPSAGTRQEQDVHALLRYHLGWEEADGSPSTVDGGKALRPLLCLMACDMAGGDPATALPAAASVELTHNFSLIHDDIQDCDTTRRGRETMWSAWGIPKAVAAGNAMWVLADQSSLVLTQSGLSAESTLAATRMLTRRTMEMIEGQYLDVSFEQSDRVTTNDYLDMIGRKTGALIESAMYIGALTATQNAHIAEAFGQCGRRLGLAFQVRDDYLGVWGDPATFGKPVGSDIQRKKKSLPVVHVFQQTTGNIHKRLLRIYQAPEIQGAEVEAVLTMMQDAGTKTYVRQTAERQSKAAIEPLEGLAISSEARHQVEALAEFFVTREK